MDNKKADRREIGDKSKAFEFDWYRYDELEKLVTSFLKGNRKFMQIKTYDYDKNDFGEEKEFDLTKNVLVPYQELMAKRSRKPSAQYLNHKEEARKIIKERLEHYNAFYAFSYKRVAIKNHKSRWGSCSEKGNLNFNYRLAHLPLRLLDYVVVHELCHLGELNHSVRFWALVEKTMPDWRKRRIELKRIHSNFRSLKDLPIGQDAL